jgi:hypothetical protein
VAKLKACHALSDLVSVTIPPEDDEMMTLVFGAKSAGKLKASYTSSFMQG